MLEFVDVKPNIFDEGVLELLKPSVFNPTPEKLKKRAEKYANNPNTHIFACRKSGKFIGVVVVEIVGGIATVLDIAVNEACRNKGVGSALLSFFFDNFSINKMIAETDDDAVEFYQKFGLTITQTKTVCNTKRYVCEYTKNHLA
ncbi:MAG: GNAT family N-acetyltransferase [Clostridia bacterium]|nr:GNAT family N-acetyltransferase [Clostridia bacterium]